MHYRVLNFEAAYLEEPKRWKDEQWDEALHHRVLFRDVIIDLILFDVAHQVDSRDEHADIRYDGLKQESNRVTVPSQTSLVEQIDSQRKQRHQNREQQERQLHDDWQHASWILQCVMGVLHTNHWHHQKIYNWANWSITSYLFIDNDNCAHEWQIEEKTCNCTHEQVSKRWDNHSMLDLVTSPADWRSRLNVRIQQILLLYRFKSRTCMLSHNCRGCSASSIYRCTIPPIPWRFRGGIILIMQNGEKLVLDKVSRSYSFIADLAWSLVDAERGLRLLSCHWLISSNNMYVMIIISVKLLNINNSKLI